MARYYLHMRDFKGGVMADDEGSELSSLAAARAEAVLAMQDFLGEAIKRGVDPPFEAIIIADEHGTQLAAVPVVGALPTLMLGLFKHPEKIIPPDRAEEYRQYADGCRSKAEEADEPSDKVAWLRLADAWLQMLPGKHSPADAAPGWPAATDEDSKASH